MKNTITKEMSSAEYHGLAGTYSSSQLKDLLVDPEIFYKKYITKEIVRESNSAFDIGSYFHCAILEPEKLDNEFIIYQGRRAGKVWEDFQAANVGKTILIDSEVDKAKVLIDSVRRSPVAMGRLKRGEPEVSAFVNIRIASGSVFDLENKKELGEYGWVLPTMPFPKKGIDLVIKVRADLLGSGFILDLKSTSGNCKDVYSVKGKVSDLQYDLSASLYLDMFNAAYGGPYYSEFIWVFASKDIGNCKSYVASEKMVRVGRAKYKNALLVLAHGIQTNWEMEDSIAILDPTNYDLDYIKERIEDFL